MNEMLSTTIKEIQDRKYNKKTVQKLKWQL